MLEEDFKELQLFFFTCLNNDLNREKDVSNRGDAFNPELVSINTHMKVTGMSKATVCNLRARASEKGYIAMTQRFEAVEVEPEHLQELRESKGSNYIVEYGDGQKAPLKTLVLREEGKIPYVAQQLTNRCKSLLETKYRRL